MAQKNQETKIAAQVTRPNGTTSEVVVDAPQAWTAGTVLEFVHQQLRALLPETHNWSWRLVKDDHQARDENEDASPTGSDYRLVLHAAGWALTSNPISVPKAVANSPAFVTDPHYGPSADG